DPAIGSLFARQGNWSYGRYSCGILARHTPPSEGHLAYLIRQASQPSAPSEPAGAHNGEAAADQVGS
ncbi:hypothetical protein K466DRAFT_593017, partial [Polyporus arcularius HHB13444]